MDERRDGRDFDIRMLPKHAERFVVASLDPAVSTTGLYNMPIRERVIALERLAVQSDGAQVSFRVGVAVIDERPTLLMSDVDVVNLYAFKATHLRWMLENTARAIDKAVASLSHGSATKRKHARRALKKLSGFVAARGDDHGR